MKQPDKWRETIDPFSLEFKQFKLSRVLGYPHAGNDVFYVEGLFEGDSVRAFLKVERQKGADVANEVRIMAQLGFSFVPEILEYNLTPPKFILTAEMPGDRLSVLVGDNAGKLSHRYLRTYGRTLAAYHGLALDCEPVKDRRFFHVRPRDYYEQRGLLDAYDFLMSRPPEPGEPCFVHGDFHYANILWQNEQISAVLDYELSGLGNREFDLAWACFLRPGQKFLDTWEEVELFLAGYAEEGAFDRSAFEYYFVLLGTWFLAFGGDEPGYEEKVRALIDPLIKGA
jgi:aminoglycoside phosphotransferase